MNSKSFHLSPAIAALFLCAAVLLPLSWQAAAQSPESEISADWKALGWSLPEGFSPDQIPLFKGLNAARGTWSFEAETVDGETTVPVTGNLEIKGGSQGGMASAWNLIWSWPAGNPRHAIVDQVMAIPGDDRFDLMLARHGPLKSSEADLSKHKPEVRPTLFAGTWDAEKRMIGWIGMHPPTKPGDQVTPEGAPAFEMVVAADGKVSIRNSENLPAGQITAGKATVRTGDAPAEPRFLTGMHSFRTGSEISDPRITRYLPAEATDITLISDRNGHMAQYRIPAEAFDEFLLEVWDRYREERAAEPKYWIDYSEEQITAARTGSPVGRYEPQLRSAEIVFDTPVVWQPLENATSYPGPRRMSHAGATYHFDRETGLACHDAGYW